MSTESKLQEDLKQAMKSGDKVTLSTLRMLKSAMGYARIEKGSDLSEDDIIQVISREAKKRRESVDAANQAGREDIVQSESAELEVLSKYLPEQMSEAEIETVISEIISSIGASSIKDQGKVMSAAMKALRGKADGKLVSSITQRLLTG